jgi:DNA polymerase (family 10)
MPYDEAMEIAQKYQKKVDPYVVRCAIAGSLRRKKETVGDIELCIKPSVIVTHDMFGYPIDHYHPLDDGAAEIFGSVNFIANGPRLKRISLSEGITLDLFIVYPPAQWGYRYAICTGPAEYNRWLVTKKEQGGAMPSDLRSKGGAIYRGSDKILMPRERDFFDALGLPWERPEDRKPPASWIPF